MSTIDPEGLELQILLKHLTFDEKRVLEIGCGEGRLTFKYATMIKDVIAIDAEAEAIERARENIPSELSSKIKFQIANGENIQFPDESFDIVLYTYSLCCFPSLKSMKKALD
ncbi:MAG: class I SAM-dependent methyltransferase [Candidatus Heimdallarchaeota archaeon]|nr:class I SAM-dependent methyltransferase [Candidatus Heimdallarchaeota archaeon]